MNQISYLKRENKSFLNREKHLVPKWRPVENGYGSLGLKTIWSLFVFIWNKTSTLFCVEINSPVHFTVYKHLSGNWPMRGASVFLQQEKQWKITDCSFWLSYAMRRRIFQCGAECQDMKHCTKSQKTTMGH